MIASRGMTTKDNRRILSTAGNDDHQSVKTTGDKTDNTQAYMMVQLPQLLR